MVVISSPSDLIELLVGYQPAAAISAASQLGLFDALNDQPQPASEIATCLAANHSNLNALLEALVQLGLVSRTDNGFTNTPFASAHLRSDSDLDKVIRKEAFFSKAWLRLRPRSSSMHLTRSPVSRAHHWRNCPNSFPAGFSTLVEVLEHILGLLLRLVAPWCWWTYLRS